MGVSACAGLRCWPWKTGVEAAEALVVRVLWRMIMKSIDDGVEAGCQINHNCIFAASQFCGNDDAGMWDVDLGQYMTRGRILFVWFTGVAVDLMQIGIELRENLLDRSDGFAGGKGQFMQCIGGG